ncbi:MAG: ferrochelatase, partial [Planctomycetota bacterium]
YRLQVRGTIDGILERVGKREWDLAWQSRPKTPGRWLGPDVDEVLASKKRKSVLVVPVGFVSDHAEVLYDIDQLCRGTAERLGVGFRRTEMLNDSPLLIEALEEVVRRVL